MAKHAPVPSPSLRPRSSRGSSPRCFSATVAAGSVERYEETFRGPPLPAGDVAEAEERRLEARDLAEALELPIGDAVDFWTEASLFSAVGLTAIVCGPGDIAQAHTADEWVALDQLQRYAESVSRILDGGDLHA